MAPFTAQITFCFTSDLAASADFCENALGLPLALDQGTCRVYQVASGGYLGFCTRAAPPPPGGVILTLVTRDVDEWHARLEERGITIERPPAHNPQYDIYHFFVRDPNGYLVEIQRFEDPRWRG